MIQLTLEFSEGVLPSLLQDPSSFGRELRLAAAAKWYELRLISQGRAAEIAGVSRAEFLGSLVRFGVSPFQEAEDELLAGLSGV